MLRGARLGLSGGPIARNRFFHKFKLVDPIKAYFIARRQSTVVFGARLKRSILMFSVSLAQINGVGATTTLAGTPFQGRIQEPKFLLSCGWRDGSYLLFGSQGWSPWTVAQEDWRGYHEGNRGLERIENHSSTHCPEQTSSDCRVSISCCNPYQGIEGTSKRS